jgi:hypothetical protein
MFNLFGSSFKKSGKGNLATFEAWQEGLCEFLAPNNRFCGAVCGETYTKLFRSGYFFNVTDQEDRVLGTVWMSQDTNEIESEEEIFSWKLV